MKRDRRRQERLRRKARGKSGYSIAESLLALLIVALLSMGIAAGVAFGVRQYNEAMTLSEARVLCSTLASVVRGELSIATSVWTEGDTVAAFTSYHYASAEESAEAKQRSFYSAEITETPNGLEPQVYSDPSAYGEIVVATKGTKADPLPVLSSAAYSRYGLKANVAVTWTGSLFVATISVGTADNQTKAVTERTSETFQIIPLNTVNLNPLSGTT